MIQFLKEDFNSFYQNVVRKIGAQTSSHHMSSKSRDVVLMLVDKITEMEDRIKELESIPKEISI